MTESGKGLAQRIWLQNFLSEPVCRLARYFIVPVTRYRLAGEQRAVIFSAVAGA